MKASKLFKAICVLGLSSSLVFMLSACGEASKNNETSQVEGLTGGVAATVNGVEINEDPITTQLQVYRERQNMLDQDAWGQFLVDQDRTPQEMREEIVNNYVKEELTRQAAAENNISIPASEIDDYVNKLRDYYNSDEEWQEALAAAGTTEEGYRKSVELALIEQAIRNDVIVVKEPTDEELLESAEMYLQSFDGAKKSSHILFDVDDTEGAQEVLDKITSGEIEFDKAATEYSTDASSSSDGGNVGWDVLNSFSPEYKEALDGLEVDKISDLITDDSGIHIVKATEEFTAPKKIKDINELPAEFVEAITSNLDNTKQAEAYDNWYNEFKESSTIEIKDMPENVPYNVDLSKYTKSTPDEGEGSDGATPGSADGDGAEGAEGEKANGETKGDASDTEGASDADSDTTKEGEAESNTESQPSEAA